MKTPARLFGIAWVSAVILGGAILIGSGMFVGNRIVIFLIFFAALPGLVAFRWGRGTDTKDRNYSQRVLRPKAPVDSAAEAGHVMQLEKDPIEAITKKPQR